MRRSKRIIACPSAILYNCCYAYTQICIHATNVMKRRVFTWKRRKKRRKGEADAICTLSRGSNMIVSLNFFFSFLHRGDRLIFNSYVRYSSSSLFNIPIKREKKDNWQTATLMNVVSIIFSCHHSISTL